MLRLPCLLVAIGSLTLAADYAAWAQKNPDGSWTATAEAAVKESALPSAAPQDAEKFCPAYLKLAVGDRTKFWVVLLSAIAKPESNFNPKEQYKEAFDDASGKAVVSRGLLQISIESANQKRYGCGIKKDEDLHDPATNLQCGVKILAAWVEADKVIATYQDDKSPRGGGRYWSTLRESHKSFAATKTYLNGLPFCQKAK